MIALKKAIINWIFKRSIKELESRGVALEDIKISIDEIDGEVYGRLERFNIVRYYETNTPMPIWMSDQPRWVEIYYKGWKLYFNEGMDNALETI